MKNLFLLLAVFGTVFSALGQDYIRNPGQPSKTELTRLKGVRNPIQAEFNRLNNPVRVVNSLAYTVTNQIDGVIFVETNATVIVRIGLPNPTNNVGRKFQVVTLGASTAVLTNVTFTGTFTDANTMAEANQYLVASNKLATAFSTGTNYVVHVD